MSFRAAKRVVPIIATTALLNKGKREESLIIIMEEKMRKILLMSSALALLSGTAEAACIQTPSCSSLGYTSSSSCSGGVKCPFGNAWNCSINDIKTEFNNKITELETTIKKVQQGSNNENKVNCKVGDILYDDFSCNENVVYTKEPIGVVFDVTNYLAVALEEKGKVAWSTTTFDISGLDLHPNDAQYDGWGKKNTRVIYEYCKANGKSCPAVEYAYEYKTAGTSAGDWHLPSYVELAEIRDNRNTINSTLEKINKTKLKKGGSETAFNGQRYTYISRIYNYWTSTAINKDNVYALLTDYYRNNFYSTAKKEFYYEESGFTDSGTYGPGATLHMEDYISRPVIAF